MVIQQQQVTTEAFEAFIALPENADRLFELIGGEIVEVPSNPYSSYIGAIILAAIMNFVMKDKSGFVTGEAGGYMVSGERYAPDVAYISKARQPELVREGYNPNPPELAVEVVSPTDVESLLRIKVVNYLMAGTMVWVVKPEAQNVEVYVPGQPVQIRGIEDTLDGGEVLPGFELTVKELFDA